ncbi:30S ribosomal protein S21 [bacterium]|nr:30S ribosomal protein S21 [bacterium]
MVKVKRQPQENSDQLLRRFLRTVQEEGILTMAKERMFHQKEPNKRARKESALRRLQLQQQKQKELRGY